MVWAHFIILLERGAAEAKASWARYFWQFLGGHRRQSHRVVELAMTGPPNQSPSPFSKAVLDGYVQDSNSVIPLFGISTDADVVLTITKFIPEIVWHAGILITPLESLYDVVLDCLDDSSGRLLEIPKLRNEAYFGAKALLHLTIQRGCLGDGFDQATFKSISDRHRIMGSGRCEEDPDLPLST